MKKKFTPEEESRRPERHQRREGPSRAVPGLSSASDPVEAQSGSGDLRVWRAGLIRVSNPYGKTRVCMISVGQIHLCAKKLYDPLLVGSGV